MPQIALDSLTRTGKNCSRARKGPRTSAHHCFFPNTNGYLNWDKFLSSNFNYLGVAQIE